MHDISLMQLEREWAEASIKANLKVPGLRINNFTVGPEEGKRQSTCFELSSYEDDVAQFLPQKLG